MVISLLLSLRPTGVGMVNVPGGVIGAMWNYRGAVGVGPGGTRNTGHSNWDRGTAGYKVSNFHSLTSLTEMSSNCTTIDMANSNFQHFSF